MNIDFTMNYDDYKAARNLHLRSSSRLIYVGTYLIPLCIVVIVGLAFQIYMDWSALEEYAGWQLWLSILLIFIFLIVFLYIFPRNWKRSYLDKELEGYQQKFKVNEDGITIDSEGKVENISWLDIEKIKKGKNTLLLYVSESAFILVPKRIFQSEPDYDEFCLFVEVQLRNSAKK